MSVRIPHGLANGEPCGSMGMMRDDRVADMSMLKCYVPSHFHQLFRRDDGNKQLLLNHSSIISHFIVV